MDSPQNNNTKNVKLGFFGTPYVARDTLEILKEPGLVPSVVVTNPDAPRGRGHTLTPSETKVWAEENNVPVITPEKLDASALKEIQSYEPELAIVVAYGKILPEFFIQAFPKGVLNIHYSLLPKYRGASPVETALLNGETVTGVTIQKMVHKLDAGDIIAQTEVVIEPSDTTPSLRSKLIKVGAELLAEVVPDYLKSRCTLTPQDEADVSYARKLKKEDGLIELADDAEVNWNKYRAYKEWPGTYYFAEKNGQQVRVKITDASLTDGAFTIHKVIPEGKKEMDFNSFQNSQ